MTNPAIVKALRGLAEQGDGLLLPEQVVEAARPVTSVLHSSFCWDNDEAARQYRIWQARELIRTTVSTIEIDGKEQNVRVFVSLMPDRERDGGGYRELIAVLQNPSAREVLLSGALAELNVFRKKYAELRELAEVFGAAARVGKKKRGYQQGPSGFYPDEVRVDLNADPKTEAVRLLSNANASIIESRSLLEMVKLADDLNKPFTKSLNALGELRFAVNEKLEAVSA